jgi:hypothetical protein
LTFTPISSGTTQWDVPLNVALQDLQDQISAEFQSSDHNLLGWTFDPASITLGSASFDFRAWWLGLS